MMGLEREHEHWFLAEALAKLKLCSLEQQRREELGRVLSRLSSDREGSRLRRNKRVEGVAV